MFACAARVEAHDQPDEGRLAKFTVNLRPGTTPSRSMALEHPIEFDAARLAKLSMATTTGVSAVHVGPGNNGLKILGIDTTGNTFSSTSPEPCIKTVTVERCSSSARSLTVSGESAPLHGRLIQLTCCYH